MIGKQLKARREALGYSQEKLARLLAIHVVTLSKWERGILAVPEMMAFALRGLELSAGTGEKKPAKNRKPGKSDAKRAAKKPASAPRKVVKKR